MTFCKGESIMAFDRSLFNDNFTFSFRATVANNMRIATKAFDKFWESNSQFLCEADDLYGRILTYAVNKQFRGSSTDTASAYLVSGKETNTYKAKAVFLNTKDYITSICRTDTPRKLPCKANYKLKLSLGNREDNQQMELFPEHGGDQLAPSIPKKYAIIGYRYINGDLRHLNIIVPDWRFKSFLYDTNLLDQINEYYNYVPQEIVEESVAALKTDIVKQAKKQNIIQ